jgi:hypothetical protein
VAALILSSPVTAIPDLALMPYREDEHSILIDHIAVKRQKTGLPLRDYKFPQPALNWASKGWMTRQRADGLIDQIESCKLRIYAAGSQEVTDVFQVRKRLG